MTPETKYKLMDLYRKYRNCITALLALAVLAVFVLIFSESDTPPALENSTTFGLQIELVRYDAAGMTVRLTRSENAAILRIEGYPTLYKWERGGWNWVDKAVIPASKPVARLPEDGTPYELEVDWTPLYGTLSPGWYRASVDMSKQRNSSHTSQDSYFVVQFEITE